MVEKKLVKKRLQLNNKGASLVTVMVIITLLIILASTMLYITSMNYQSKQIDYGNKYSFYEAETALDSLRAIVVLDTQKAYEEAYWTTLTQYASLNEEARKSLFMTTYIDELNQVWSQRIREAGDNKLETAIKTLLRDHGVEENLIECFQDASMLEEGEEHAGIVADVNKGKFILKNIRVCHIENGYATYIYTCIACNVPEIDLSFSAYQEWNDSMNASMPIEWKRISLEDYVIYVNWKKY